jgi:uncharacterized protein HemX
MAQNTVTEKRTTRHAGNGDAASSEARVTYYEHMESVKPMDRIRWGAVFAGLVTALSTLLLLSILGLAIGLTTFEQSDQLSNFGIGAGIWGAISTIVAFLLGGWVAASTAAVRGRSNALLNGAMVWAVAIPLIMYLLGSGVGSMINTATDAAAAGATAVTEATNPTAGDAATAVDTAQAQVQQIDPATVENAAQNAGEATWGTLLALLLGLAAAVGGGLMGQRREAESYQTAYSS